MRHACGVARPPDGVTAGAPGSVRGKIWSGRAEVLGLRRGVGGGLIFSEDGISLHAQKGGH